MIFGPDFLKNGNEMCHNHSVDSIIKHAIEEGKKMIPDKKFTSCLMRIRNELHEYTNINIQTKRATCVSPVLIKAEQLFNGSDKIVCHDMNCFMSEIINNYDRIERGECPPLEENYNENLIRILGFGLSKNMFTAKPETQPTFTYFNKRWSWYNQSVNFEHVCFVVALILLRKVEISPKYSERIVYPFLYFLVKYKENKEQLQYFVYHLMKFIRVDNTRALGDRQYVWNPFTYMTNFAFGSFMDPNVEIYGNTRLSTDKRNILSMFSNAPRSTADTAEKAIWFNWNEITPIIEMFTHESEDIWKATFGLQDERRKFTNQITLFNFLMSKDILPRNVLANNEFLNLYHRCVVSSDAETTDEELINAMISLLLKVGATNYTPGRRLGSAKIGITYFEGPLIKSRILNITLDQLANKLNLVPSVSENVEIVPYIVKCYIDKQHIRRHEIGITDDKFNELLQVIESTREAIKSL